MEKTKEQHRKELVFQILDDLKEAGDRINADKVAKLAQMGKQTILPYYNEWRFLTGSLKSDEAELPVSLTRALQGLLVQWKHEVAEELTAYKSHSEQEMDDLKRQLKSLADENEHLQQQLTEAVADNEQLVNLVRENQQELLRKNQTISEEKNRVESREEIIASMKEQLQGLRQEHEALMTEQEKKLDQHYKLQIDHWMKVLDDERQQKQTSIKEQRAQQTELLDKEKEKGSLENQLEHKSQAYIEACQERNELRQTLRGQKPSVECIGMLSMLTATEESGLVNRVRSLLAIEQQHEKTSVDLSEKTHTITSLKERLKDSERQEKSIHSLMMELEKSKGYAMALEKSLGAVQAMEKK